MELLGKLTSKEKSNTRILPSASKDGSICWMVLKVTQNLKRENKNKILTIIYTVFKGITTLNIEELNGYGKTIIFTTECYYREKYPYVRKGFLRNYHYWDDPKLYQGGVDSRTIPWCCYDCTTQLYLTWDPKIKYACNNPRYGKIFNCKYSPIIRSHNNWFIMNFLEDETYDVEY